MSYITQAQVGSGSYQLKDAEVNGGSTLKLAINPSAAEISAFDVGSMWIEVPPNALKFSSDSAFTLSVSSPKWNGTIEYSTDGGRTWTTWNGSRLSGTADQPIYLRGRNNTRISYASGAGSSRFEFTGKHCTGNIETLLDYQTVENGNHPSMDDSCFNSFLYYNTALETAPDLPAPILTQWCYDNMFAYCSALVNPPKIAATSMDVNSCLNMFAFDTSLVTPPQLLATDLAPQCYDGMFVYCTSLTTLPKLPANTLEDYCYEGMFSGCSKIKLSTTQTGEYQYPYRIPTSGTGAVGSSSLSNMFANTGGTFTGTPTINTTYYTDHEPI